MVSSEDFVEAGIIAAAVLAVLLVALSTYGRRRLRHPALRFVMWGSSTVFLPLTSSIISSLLRTTEPKDDGTMPPSGKSNPHVQSMWTLLLWIVLILTVKCNADIAAVAVAVAAASPAGSDVSLDGQRIRPPVELLAQYAWVTYLIVVCFPLAGWLGALGKATFVAFSALGLAKVALKLAAFWSASGSFAVGKNARLISGYMAQLVIDGNDGHEQVPRYIVIGESKKHVEESAQGYRVKRDVLEDNSSGLVTLDLVWRMAERGDSVLAEWRDLCLSYSLFKTLRRRLSGYPLADAGSVEALDFVLRGMDSVGAGGSDDLVEAKRLFGVLLDELWFASDFYFSSVPLCTFGGWCAAVNHLLSVLIIVGAVAVGCLYLRKDVVGTIEYYVITFSLLLAVVLVETWEIVAGVCSNWTKMTLLGHYIRHESLWRRQSSLVQGALRMVLRLKPAKRWRDKIGQNSILEPRRFLRRTGLLSEQIYGRAGLMESVEVLPAVKDAVLRSLRSSYGRLGNGGAAARRVSGKVDWALYGSQKSWARDGDGTSNTERILTWHVGTRLFEMATNSRSASDRSASADMIAACHLSYYCTYLVAVAPELLPDCAAWTIKRYRQVSEDVSVALGADAGGSVGGSSESTAGRYERVVQALSAGERDTVLRRGAELGRHLVEEYGEDQASACRILADFWSEMMLYIAPSENVKGHVEAMARGGEFITLVWALLLHAGVTTRPDTPAGGSP